MAPHARCGRSRAGAVHAPTTKCRAAALRRREITLALVTGPALLAQRADAAAAPSLDGLAGRDYDSELGGLRDRLTPKRVGPKLGPKVGSASELKQASAPDAPSADSPVAQVEGAAAAAAQQVEAAGAAADTRVAANGAAAVDRASKSPTLVAGLAAGVLVAGGGIAAVASQRGARIQVRSARGG